MRRSTGFGQALVVLLLVFGMLRAVAEVKEVVISSRGPWLGGRAMGAAGPYEKLQGRITYSIDPNVKSNLRIADIGVAPRNDHGMVEFSSDFVILRPIDSSKARSSVFLEVLNRGTTQANGSFFSTSPNTTFNVEALESVKMTDSFLFDEGFTVAWVGWQFDLPKGNVRLTVPIAPIQSIVREEIVSPDEKEAAGVHSLSSSYCAADAAQPAATLTTKEHFDGPMQLLARESWSFANLAAGKAVPDPCSILLPGGFKPGLMYEAIYMGAPAPVAGLGLAAVRDFVSYLKYGGVASPLREHPKTSQRVLGYGYSQSARFLRQYLYQGFTADERGRTTFDAMFIASAGAGRGSFNHRYAVPGDAGNSVLSDLRPVDLFPFTDRDEFDPVTSKREGLLDEALRSKTLPKIFYTYSSTEFWARVGSLAYCTVNGSAELPIDPDARLYFFAGTPHAPGPFPPVKVIPTTSAVYSNFANFAFSGWSFRALLLDLEAWVVHNEEPPASVYPHMGRDLVERENVRFPKIPGMDFPSYMPDDWRMDFGPDFLAKGVIEYEPPKLGPKYSVLVPQVDEDGNDLGGIALPFLAVPLGTYTGWNYELPRLESFGYLGGLVGGFQPFAQTKAQRLQMGDPRKSIEERYKDRESYLADVHTAALNLLRSRLIRIEDLDAIQKESAEFWDKLAKLSTP